VVSEALQKELEDRGIARDKILVNPNAVDPDLFRPDCRGNLIRSRLGVKPQQVVVGFIGSFSYWHGIGVLEEAIHLLLKEQENAPGRAQLRFLLIGDGPLGQELRDNLREYWEYGSVIFTGKIPHVQAPQYLDATDILLSPHVPMPDGTPFFGSPTKIFEYMAMGKAIIASNLDQLGRVLTHQETAWLVEPGNPRELADSIRLLAARPEVRKSLGENARKTVMAQYTWQQNANRVLARFAAPQPQAELRHTHAA
jgi:glycosyltransferase involved in cell wall biosynthesis